MQSTLNPNETKKSTYYNLSKLNYKDGLILKDAANSKPGYGLWAIKLSKEKKSLKKIDEENNNIMNNLKIITVIFIVINYLIM